ncbi:protein phosphatase 1 regulatory subunit 16A-like [Ylistrum balloti]|uniref:protein phosphatase 1 regulatory subunit 16A-like n=1 Tax=Ylistrum balloti TaxID=509963 RepID=UPI00290595C7|nr:protein phosphatase 1 regulatory subunit 16A-like [Ylistrum balloti]
MEESLIDLSEVVGTNLLSAIRQQDGKEAIRLLRNSNIDVTVTDMIGMGCLHYAATSDRFTDITRQLIVDKGMDVNTKDVINQTPLHKATSSGEIDVMVMLVALGGDLAAVDDMNNLPLTLAVKDRNVIAAETLMLLGSPAIMIEAPAGTCDGNDETLYEDETLESLEASLMEHEKTVEALKYG